MKPGTSILVLSLLASCLAARQASSATATASFGVSVNVQASCRASSTVMTLGAYGALVANEKPAVSVSCTIPTVYIVSLSSGRGAGPTGTAQRMVGPSSKLPGFAESPNFEHQPNLIQQIGTYTTAGNGNGSVPQFNVSSETIGAQYMAPGAYADTIIVTITY